MIFVNGVKQAREGTLTKQYKVIPGGGELVVGQSSRLAEGHFNVKTAFVGSLAFINIWSEALSAVEVTQIYTDCTLTLCGNVIQWADFRSGTRGALSIKWPSFIYGSYLLFVVYQWK